MSKVQVLETEIEISESIIEELREQLEEAKGEQFFKCTDCGKRSKVNGLTLLINHWYAEPRGSTEGWWNFLEYLVICIKCNHAIRVCDKSEYSDYNNLFDFVQTRRHQFAEVLDYFPRSESVINLESIRKQNENARKYGRGILL